MEVFMQLTSTTLKTNKIILLNPNWENQYQDFYCRKYCKNCLYNSQCKDSILVMGTSSKADINLSPQKIDILMIGDKPAYPEDPRNVIQICKEEKNNIDSIKKMNPYVIIQDLEKTLCAFYKSYVYGSEINRKIISHIWKRLDKYGYSWVYTDYLKNYYSKESYSRCVDFLLEQICMFKPECIITFGRPVFNFFIKKFHPKGIYGGISDNHGKSIPIEIPCKDHKHNCIWIISMFPGGANYRFNSIHQADELINKILDCCRKE